MQVSSNSPGSTPRRRSVDPTMINRRKMSASKEPKLNVDALNELNKKNKTADENSPTSSTIDRVSKLTAKSPTTKTEVPSVEISNPPNKFTMETKVGSNSPQRAPSPLSQEKTTARSLGMIRQEGVTDIRKSRGMLVNGEVKVNGEDKVMTTAKPPLVASKEPVVTSKPPTPKPQDITRDSKSNNLKNTRKEENLAAADTKDTVKEQPSVGTPSRRISQYRLSGSEALHIFHPTRRSAIPKGSELSETTSEHDDDSRTNSPAPPPSKSPTPDKRVSKRDSKPIINTTEETTVQQQPPPKSPVTRRPGVVESKTKKMLALLGKEASVDIDRPADIPRASPVSVDSLCNTVMVI